MEKLSLELAHQVLLLNRREQVEFLRHWLAGLLKGGSNKKHLDNILVAVGKCITRTDSKQGKGLAAMETWTEKRYRSNLDEMPYTVALEYLRYKRLPHRMLPLAIKTAQRVKHRLRMRLQRASKPRAARVRPKNTEE
jgi:hypothetical protein